MPERRRIIQMVPATSDWEAVYVDGSTDPVVAWALVDVVEEFPFEEEHVSQVVVGIAVADGSAFPVEPDPEFAAYRRRPSP